MLVAYTAFAMQNRTLVPIKLFFDAPNLYFLPLIALVSFALGSIFSAAAFVFYYMTHRLKTLPPEEDEAECRKCKTALEKLLYGGSVPSEGNAAYDRNTGDAS